MRRSTPDQRMRVAMGMGRMPSASVPSVVYSGGSSNMQQQWGEEERRRNAEHQKNVKEREQALHELPTYVPPASSPNVFGTDEEEVYGRNPRYGGIEIRLPKQGTQSHLRKVPTPASNYQMPSTEAMNRTPTPNRRNAFTAIRASQYSGTKSEISLPSQFALPTQNQPSAPPPASSSYSGDIWRRSPSPSGSGPVIPRNPDGSIVLSQEAIESLRQMRKDQKVLKAGMTYLKYADDKGKEEEKAQENIADSIQPSDSEGARNLLDGVTHAPTGPAFGQNSAGPSNSSSDAPTTGTPSSSAGSSSSANSSGGEPPPSSNESPPPSGGEEGEAPPPAPSSAVAAPQAGAGAGPGGGGGIAMHGETPRPSGEGQEKMKPPVPNNPLGGGGGAGGPGQNTPPVPNSNSQGQGDYVPPPYGDGSAFAEKAREGDSDRLDPITPATGSKQTPATANSIIGADPIYASAKKQRPDKVFGSAEERANMGKGAPSGYEFNGPYDFPSRPSGRPDTSLTAIGGWRSKTGEHTANLWKSTLTARGEPSKRDNYYKWSSKGGGSWKNLSARDSMRVFTKMEARRNGARWLAQPNPGQELTHLMGATLKRKMQDINAGKKGNERMNKRKKGDDPKNNFQTQM